MITPTHYMLLSAALFIIGVIGVMVRRNIIIIFMSIELILNAVNINLVAVLRAAAERRRPGLRDLRHRGGGGRGGGRARDHPGLLPQQGNDQHRRNEPDAVVGRVRSRQDTCRSALTRSAPNAIHLVDTNPSGHRRRDQRPARDPLVLAQDRRRGRLHDDDGGARPVAVRVLAAAGAAGRRARLRRHRRATGFRASRSRPPTASACSR